MNVIAPRTLRHLSSLASALFLAWASSCLHASFTFDNEDLVLAFRQSGGVSELVVNLGPVSDFEGLPNGQVLTLDRLDTNQLGLAFASWNQLKWSVSCAQRTAGNPDRPIGTLWLSRSRSKSDLQSRPWLRQTEDSQGVTSAKVVGIGTGAMSIAGLQPGGPGNTDTGLVEPAGHPKSYGVMIGVQGNLGGTFQGNIETVTPTAFDVSREGARADLYRLVPGLDAEVDTPGTYLGFIELKPDGALTFNTPGGSVVVPRPTIGSVQRVGDVNRIAFSTDVAGRYQVRAAGVTGLATPVSSWSTVGASLAGTGLSVTVDDATTESVRFYVVEASPQ